MALGLPLVCEPLAANAQEANNERVGTILIEQLGGIVGGGTPTGHLRVEGRVDWSALSPADQAQVNALFAAHTPVNENLRYRLTRNGPDGPEAVEAPASAVPAALMQSIKTSIE